MSLAKCDLCGKVGSHPEIDNHDCPFSVEPLDGESFEAFVARAAIARAAAKGAK